MANGKRTLAYRLLVPLLGIIAGVTVALLVLIARISDHIIDDYHRYISTGFAMETKRVLDRALAELTTARLLENPAVVEVKQRQVIEAIAREWKERRLEGTIQDRGGDILLSTMPDGPARRIAALPPGPFRAELDGRELHGIVETFPAWGWRVATAARTNVHQLSRKGVTLLVPLVALGSLLMLGALLLLLRRNLQRPVAALVAAVRSGRDVAPTGVAEFDQIGSAMGEALRHVREKEERIRLLLSSTAEGIYGIDTNGVCTFCNPAALRMLGYENEQDLLGRSTHELMHHTRPDGSSYSAEACLIYSAYHAGRSVHADHELFWRRDGSSFPVEYWSSPVVKDGTVQGAVVNFIDITERKRTEADVREERNKFEAVLAAMGDGVSIQDRAYRILYQNEVHKSFIGPHVGEYCYRAYESREALCDGCPVARTFEDGKVHRKERSVELGGAVRHFEIITSPLRDGAGIITAGIELVRDVTERRRTEDQLRQAQKMEAVGRLAGGIAHDFNNILTAITGYASFIKKRMSEDDPLRTYASQILLAGEKAADLTRQILAFSRKQVLAPRNVRINEIIGGMEKILLRLLGEDIEIRMDLTAADTTVLVDPGQIEQVLLNLSTNARDAMPAGGSFLVRTEVIDAGPDAAVRYGLARPGRYVLLSFSDTGEGMTEQVRQRIFEPFFTTKELGKGTGLGLAIVYGIVIQHGGSISVYSEPGQGTTFKICLPLVAQPGAGPRPAPDAGMLPRGTETILLAEDDEMVRTIHRLTLEEAGYHVVAAENGEEAVRLFLTNPKAVHLCIFDIIMPKKNGKAALDEIRRVVPDMRAIYISGYAADLVRARDIIDTDVLLLSKPIAPPDLLRRVREVLDA